MSSRDIEMLIADIAIRQHGVVRRSQLADAGIGPDVVDRRVAAGRLHRMHRGVYRVGPVALPQAREMAAALTCGADAAVSFASAGALWLLLSASGGDVHVTLRRGKSGGHAGIRVHHIRTLREDEITTLENIPITMPARTLYDLASCATDRDLERA